MTNRVEVLRKLRIIASLKLGEDDWEKKLGWGGLNDWGPQLSELCGQAADLIDPPSMFKTTEGLRNDDEAAP